MTKNKSLLLAIAMLCNVCLFAQKLTTDKIPAVVQATFKSKFPTAANVKWEKESATAYEATFSTNGQKQSATFNKDGQWQETETEIAVTALPKPVAETLGVKYAGYKIKEANKLETPGNSLLYEVDITNAKSVLEVQLKPDGTVSKSKDETRE